MDKEQWSEKSKNSYSFDHNIYEDFYEDIKYKCICCSSIVVFTGADQKISFEIEKNYIWQRRILCPKCYQNLQSIKSKITDIRSSLKEKNHNKIDLNEALKLSHELQKYGRGMDSDLESKVIKLLIEKV